MKKAQQRVGPPPIDPREAEIVENMRLDVMGWVYNDDNIKRIVKEYRDSSNTSLTTGALAYKVTKLAAEKQQRFARAEMDMDMMMGVSTEAIDMLMEVAQAANTLPKGVDIQRMREDSLLRAVTIHGETLESQQKGGFTQEQKAAAQIELRDYMSDGGTQKAFDYVNERSHKEGLNPFDMMRTGNEAIFGTKHPLQDGIKRGLMDSVPKPLPPVTAGGPQEEAAAAPPTPTGIQEQPSAAVTAMQAQPLVTATRPETAPALPVASGIQGQAAPLQKKPLMAPQEAI